MSWIDEAVVTTLQERQDAQAREATLEARVAAMEEAVRSAGIASYTVEQGETWIDQQYAGATTMLEGFAATRKILKKMLPLLLRTRL